MFSVNQKRLISDRVQQILRETNHPKLPEGERQFSLSVDETSSSHANCWNLAPPGKRGEQATFHCLKHLKVLRSTSEAKFKTSFFGN